MERPFDYPYTLDMTTVDFTGQWQPGAIFRAMQSASGAHCDQLHLSYQELARKGLAWVLTRALVVMDEYPILDDHLIIHTWPTKGRHTFFPRQYTFEKDGRLIGKATALYVLLDLETRKIALPTQLPAALESCDLPAPLPIPGSISHLEGKALSTPYTPTYTDLDMNRHVNNTRYVDWFMNRFPCQKHQQQELSEILVHYAYELRPEEPISLELRSQDDLSVLHGVHEGVTCFSIQGRWRSRP